jgi:hypothetical protein
MTIIRDGSGKYTAAKVNDSNRLVVEAVSSDRTTVNLLDGRVFTLATGVINLTSASESAILYFAHSETNDDLLGTRMILWSSDSTGATASTGDLTFYLGSTGMPAGTSFTPIANSIDSSKQLTGTFLKGAEGATLTGGTAVTTHIVPVGTPYILDFNALYAKDNSLGVTFTPPTGNTSVNISYVIITELVTAENY